MLLHTLLAGLCAVAFVAADIPSTVEDHPTECKRCPYNLCTNKVIYDPETKPNMTLKCYTEGDAIVGDTTWLRTDEVCYVSQYDLVEFDGDYSVSLPHCERIPKHVTRTPARTRFYTECWTGPSYGPLGGTTERTATKMYKPEIDLAVTCVVPNAPFRGSDPLQNGTITWYKTDGNCFVYGASLYPIAVPGGETIEDCGPVLETIDPDWHLPDPGNSTVASTGTSWKGARPENETKDSGQESNDVDKRSSLERRWLWPTVIQEDYPVNCTTGSSFYDRWTNVTHVYHQNDTVNIQCAIKDYDDLTFTIMLFTTDFCFIRDYEVKPGLKSDITRTNRYPACGSYVDEVA